MTTNSTAAPEGATTLTTKPTWRDIRAAYDLAEATLPDEASDAQLDACLAAWHDAMCAEADNGGAIRWKVEQFVKGAGGGAYRDDLHQDYLSAIMADVQRPMMELALAWLDRWTANGGSVQIDDELKPQYSYPADSGEPMRESGLGEQADRQDSCWRDGRWHGVMHTLFEVLRMQPAISVAIKSHMVANGLRAIAPKREQGK
jgi:hypothetical protein